MTMFGLELKHVGDLINYYPMYRWISKYNGAHGPWCLDRKEAEIGGKEHHKIILALHGKEAIGNNTPVLPQVAEVAEGGGND